MHIFLRTHLIFTGRLGGEEHEEHEAQPIQQRMDNFSQLTPHRSGVAYRSAENNTRSESGYELDPGQSHFKRTERRLQSELPSTLNEATSQPIYGKPLNVGAPLRAEYFRSIFSENEEESERPTEEDGYLSTSISDHEHINEWPIDRASMEAMFSRGTSPGILPGYPSEEAMNRLIAERLYDDHIRATGAGVGSSAAHFVNHDD